MNRKGDVPYLRHILEAIEAIESFMKGKSFDDFCRDDYFQSAVIRKLEIIGEAAVHISRELKISVAEVPWEPIIAARNRLIHGYFAIDEAKAWKMVTVDIPALKQQIVSLLEMLQKEEKR